MNTKKLTIARCGDWMAIYIDGKCVDEGDPIPLSRILKLLGHQTVFIDVDPDWLDDHGVPENLADITKDSEETV